MKIVRVFVLLDLFSIIADGAMAADDAEILSTRVPNQSYRVLSARATCLRRGEAYWLIPLWACDPATFTSAKFRSGPAPYAVIIVTPPNHPMAELWTHRRLRKIHFLAASVTDAVKIKRALGTEIATMHRKLETRQGNRPGFLKTKTQSGSRK